MLMRFRTDSTNMKKNKKEITHSLTLDEAKKRVKAINPSFTLKKVYEEYVVNFGKGRGTYFTDDLQDAVDTATTANSNLPQSEEPKK